MPASGPVSMRSAPSNWFTSVDLPAFGRPTIAMRSGAPSPSGSSVSSSSGSGVTKNGCSAS
jgi:hypothetical protein